MKQKAEQQISQRKRTGVALREGAKLIYDMPGRKVAHLPSIIIHKPEGKKQSVYMGRRIINLCLQL